MVGRIRQRKPSPALVVAVIALVVGATGSALGLPGHDTVDSRDVINSSLKSKDLSNTGGVKSADLVDGKAVGRVDLIANQRTLWALIAGNGTIVEQSGGITVDSASN